MATHTRSGMRTVVCFLLILTLAINYPLFAMLAGLVWPEASGDVVHKKSGTVVDASHAQDGYIMVKTKESKKVIKTRVSQGDSTWTYDQNGKGNYEVYPLQAGDGKYNVRVLQQAKGNQYAQLSSINFSVKGMTDGAQFLCPNQYVWYTADSPVVAKSHELLDGIEGNLDKVKAANDFMKTNFTYDYMLAVSVQSGYLPDIDAKFEKKTGICFDIAAVLACMLRVQGIPTKLVIGYADKQYHAWNECIVDGQTVRLDATAALSGSKVSKYTPERYY